MLQRRGLVGTQNNTAGAHLLHFGFPQNVTFDDSVAVSTNITVLLDVTP